jgi:hypothetical protein
MVRGLAAAIGLTHTPMEPTEIRVMKVMLQMGKIDIAKLHEAYNG